MSQEGRYRRYGQHKEIDKSIFSEKGKSAPSVTEQAQKFQREADMLIANILRKEGVWGQHVVDIKGKRVIVKISGIAREIMYKLSSLIAAKLEELKQSLFKSNRFVWHHSIVINGELLANSH